MKVRECTMMSGGAVGSDCEFERIGRLHGLEKVKHFYHGRRTPRGNVEITDQQLAEGMVKVHEANRILKRSGYERYSSLLGRNWFQIKDSGVVVAIATVSNGQVDGGTGWGVVMSAQAGKDTFVFEQELNQWFSVKVREEGLIFKPSELPQLTLIFGAIGTREINRSGQAAIESLYGQYQD